MNPERFEVKIEKYPTKEKPVEDLLEIYAAKNSENLEKLSQVINEAQREISQITDEIGPERAKENLDWLPNNNNRIDLYQITAVINGENPDQSAYPIIDKMDGPRAKQFLAYRKIQAALLSMGETDKKESIDLLSGFIEKNHNTAYLCDTAIDSLAKNNLPQAQEKLLEIIDKPEYGLEPRIRAILAGLRSGLKIEDVKIAGVLQDQIEALGENLCNSSDAFNIIEIAGLMPDKVAAKSILDDLYQKMQALPEEKTKWFVEDVVSTRLAVDPKDRKRYLDKTLGKNRYYITKEGISFGVLDPNFDFEEFLSQHKEKFDKISKVVSVINKAFGSEPIKYMNIRTGDELGIGWAQNSIYTFDKYINWEQNIEDLLQSVGHEACERWQSKGFIDIELAKYYLQLMGKKYNGSKLDKLRLNHRMARECGAGHPWDGEREFIAELGSTLLVDPERINKLFNPETDKTAIDALNYLRTKLKIEK